VRTGSLTVTDNAAGSPHRIPLSGIGVGTYSPDHLLLSPANATITAGGSQSYHAEAYDKNNVDLGDVTGSAAFSLDGARCPGNICSPTAAGTHTVTAQYQTATGTASLTVTGASLDHVTLSPASASITAGNSQSYAVEGFDQYGNDLGSQTSASTLTINPDGSCSAATCTASAAGPHTVTAVASGKTAEAATLTVTPASMVGIEIIPPGATITAGGSQVFTVYSRDSYANRIADVTASTSFSIRTPASCNGNVCTTTQQGVYDVAASYSGYAAYASLTVNPGPLDHLTISPASSSITAGGSQDYTVMAYDQYNNVVGAGNVTASSAFSIAPDGSCTGASCTATKAGDHRVTATYGGKSAIASLTVSPGAAATLTLTPASVTITAGGSQAYSTQAADQYGNSLGDVTGSTVFWVDANTAPCNQNICGSTKAGAHQVIATFQSARASAALTVNPGPATSLLVTPASLTVVVGKSASLSVSATDQYANDVATDAAAWSVTSGTPGSISPATGSSSTFTASSTVSAYGNVVVKLGALSAQVPVSVLPAAPTSLAVNVNGHKANLSWTAPAGAATYTIYRNSGSGWIQVKSGVTSTSYSDGNLPSGSYSYYVTAWSAAGLESAPSNTVTSSVK
jgi:hypothetical protein